MLQRSRKFHLAIITKAFRSRLKGFGNTSTTTALLINALRPSSPIPCELRARSSRLSLGAARSEAEVECIVLQIRLRTRGERALDVREFPA